jgi:hypothetical protein
MEVGLVAFALLARDGLMFRLNHAQLFAIQKVRENHYLRQGR